MFDMRWPWYAQALKGVGQEWLNLPLTLSSADDAEEQLRRLEPLLAAIHARLIIVVEDLDRDLDMPDMVLHQEVKNAAFDESALSRSTQVVSRVSSRSAGRVAKDLESLFARLVDLERVGFVLALSRPGVIDLSRICERIEPVRRIEHGLVLEVLAAFRNHAIGFSREAGDLQPNDVPNRGGLEDLRDYQSIDIAHLGIKTIHTALAELLSTPRVLKQALRHAWEAWQVLHGEVEFDDLLLCHVIRSSSSNAFDVLIDDERFLAKRRHDGETPPGIREDWDARVTDCTQANRELLWNLAGFLFPNAHIVFNLRMPPPCQGVQRAVYFDRVIRGRVAEPVTDQQILQAISAWKHHRSNSNLAKLLATDVDFTKAFERIVEGRPNAKLNFSDTELLQLTSEVLSFGLDTYGAEADMGSIPGFLPLKRNDRDRQMINGREEWLRQEIRKSFTRSLALANDLEQAWSGSEAEAEFRGLKGQKSSVFCYLSLRSRWSYGDATQPRDDPRPHRRCQGPQG